MLYIAYAMLCIPAQGFNTIYAMVAIVRNVSGMELAADGVFVWCSFLLVMGRAWLGDGAAAWFELGRLEKFLASGGQMLGSGPGYGLATLIISICFGIFVESSLNCI